MCKNIEKVFRIQVLKKESERLTNKCENIANDNIEVYPKNSEHDIISGQPVMYPIHIYIYICIW